VSSIDSDGTKSYTVNAGVASTCSLDEGIFYPEDLFSTGQGQEYIWYVIVF
jgi:hypothetical protein